MCKHKIHSEDVDIVFFNKYLTDGAVVNVAVVLSLHVFCLIFVRKLLITNGKH